MQLTLNLHGVKLPLQGTSTHYSTSIVIILCEAYQIPCMFQMLRMHAGCQFSMQSMRQAGSLIFHGNLNGGIKLARE